MAAICNLGFLKSQNFKILLADGFRGPRCIIVPNLSKIGQYFKDILIYCISLIFQNEGSLAFSKFKCFCFVVPGRPIYISKTNFIKIGLEVSEILQFVVFTAAILNFTNSKILLADHVQRAERHSRTKFHQNWTIHNGDITNFRLFKMTAMLDFENSQILLYDGFCRAKMHHLGKFRQNLSIRCGIIVSFPFFKMAATRHLGFLNSQFLLADAVRGRVASLCQLSSKLAKRFLRYHDFLFFKMAAVRHLGFV